MELVLIAAKAKNNVIGDDNRLIWRLKSDMKRFRALTMGHPVIMGRKTFQSIGKPLPGRSILVLSRDAQLDIPDVIMARSPQEALERARAEAARLGVKAIFVAGGGEIYRLFMDQADRLEITQVGLEPEGDATFPLIEASRWKLSKEVSFTKSGDDEAEFSFQTYLRR